MKTIIFLFSMLFCIHNMSAMHTLSHTDPEAQLKELQQKLEKKSFDQDGVLIGPMLSPSEVLRTKQAIAFLQKRRSSQ